MYLDNPLECVSAAVGAAIHRDLPEVPAKTYTLAGKERLSGPRRPYRQEVKVYVFPETWANTALGYGGMGGQAITTAYTTIVASLSQDAACVYWGAGGRLGKAVSYARGQEFARALSTQLR